MKFELKDFQVTATKALLDRMLKARDAYYRDGDPTSCCLASPTGSGKTIMVAAAVEAIFNGNPEWGIERDPFATVLWVSDSPSLNEQTIYKFREATDLDPTLIETIENTFTGDHDELEPGHIYFLNRQKLSSAGLLTKGGEIPTFWQLLRRTVNDSSVHLYMLYDEAHKGLGSADKKDTAGETITSRIIDGDDGKCPIPVVVGISATPKRFTAAMEGRSERIPYPVVKVSPADVQASGLLKDKIVLQAPTEGAAVYNIYLNDACKTLVQSTALWQMYCEQNDAPMVRPLMVVQVPNKISQDMRVCLRKMISAQNLFHKKPKKNLELHRSMLKTQELRLFLRRPKMVPRQKQAVKQQKQKPLSQAYRLLLLQRRIYRLQKRNRMLPANLKKPLMPCSGH